MDIQTLGQSVQACGLILNMVYRQLGNKILCAGTLELDLLLGCSTVQKQPFIFMTQLPEACEMAVLHLMNCMKSHTLAQQCPRCGPCPTWLLCGQPPQAHPVQCDTPAVLGLACSQGDAWVRSLPAQGFLCGGLNMSKEDYFKFSLVGTFCVCLLNVQQLGFLFNCITVMVCFCERCRWVIFARNKTQISKPSRNTRIWLHDERKITKNPKA